LKLSSEAELFEAIRRGDVETVRGMLESDAELVSCRKIKKNKDKEKE